MLIMRIAGFEFLYTVRTLAFFISVCFFGVLGLIAYPYIEAEGASDLFNMGPNVFVNSPFFITVTLLMLTQIAMFFVPTFISGAINRDTDCHFDGILYSQPLSKASFVFGRFLGAYALLCLAVSFSVLGMLAGTWVFPHLSENPNTLGPTNLFHYSYVFVLFNMPVLAAVSAMVLLTSVVTRKAIYAYLAVVGLIILVMLVSVLSSTRVNLIPSELFVVFDPFLATYCRTLMSAWTPVELNTQLVPIDGLMLINRILWIGIAAVFLLLSYQFFSFKSRNANKSKLKIPIETQDLAKDAALATPNHIEVMEHWSWRTALVQFHTRLLFEFKRVFLSIPFVLFLLIGALFLTQTFFSLESAHGGVAIPLTRVMVSAIANNMPMALAIVLVFYTGEVIWRERQCGFNRILDALPTPNWVFVVSKLAAIILVLFAVVLLAVFIAVIIQWRYGVNNFEWALYGERALVYFFLPFVSLAIVCCFVQILCVHRFVGIAIVGCLLFVSLLLPEFGFEHPLYRFSFIGDVRAPLTDMNGSGRFIIGGYWLRFFDLSVGGLFLLATYLLWHRGIDQPLILRLRRLRQVVQWRIAIPAAGLSLLTLGTGAFIFYNTNIVNDYYTREDLRKYATDYEKKYGQFDGLTMPKVVAVDLAVDIYPRQRRIETQGEYVLRNVTMAELRTVHLKFPEGLEVSDLALIHSEVESADGKFLYYILKLNSPLMPNEERTLRFSTTIQQRGFKHRNEDYSLVANGTFFNNTKITPHVGYRPSTVAISNQTRREYGVEPINSPPLDDVSSHQHHVIRKDSDYVRYHAVVSTVANQAAITAGELVSQWHEDERAYFEYTMDQPIINFVPFFSAEYKVAKEEWQGIPIEIFHHPSHTYNLESIFVSAKAGLEYFSQSFGPYPFKQLRIVENPAYRPNSQAFAGTIAYSESNGFVTRTPNVPFGVTAHELSHQWWGHQVSPAAVQGAPMLVETLAQYSAVMLQEHNLGEFYVRRWDLPRARASYLRNRAGDRVGELPLYQVTGESYIAYQKGKLVMYALQYYLGEEFVNRCLQELVQTSAYKPDRYALSTDFIDILKRDVDTQYLTFIEDLFQRITLYDFDLRQVDVNQLDNGHYKISINVNAQKFYADPQGNEIQADLDIPVDIGLFLRHPKDPLFTEDDIIHLKKVKLAKDGKLTEFIVEQKPLWVGVDPFNILIERNIDDNLVDLSKIEKRKIRSK